MKKVAKAILIALGIILAVVTVMVVLGVNLYVQSASTRARVERGLSTGLHTPLKIGSLSFMPWYGLKLSAISRDTAGVPADGNSLEIAAISVRLSLWKLMRHDVVIKELTVDGVKVSWTQNDEGKWQMPAIPAPSTGELPAQPEPTPAETPASEQPPARPSEPRPVTVKSARMRDASFSFYDKNHKPVAEFSGIYVQTVDPTDKLVEGNAAIKNVAIQKEFHIEDWKGRFKYTPDELSLFDTSCTVDEGTAKGALDVKISQRDSPFVLDTDFSGVNLERLLADAGVTELQAKGMISGFVYLEGNSRDSSQAKGQGRIVLANGEIITSELLGALGTLLQTDKLRTLNFEDAHADFHVGEGRVFLDDLTLKSPALVFTSKGVMGADGNGLYLQCRISINNEITRQIPGYLLQNFGTDAANGARYVDFTITGDINHPKPDLFKVLGKNLSLKNGASELWKSLTGGEKHAETPPAATPEPAPAQQQPPAPNP